MHGVIDCGRKIGVSKGKVLVDQARACLVEGDREVVGEVLTSVLQHDFGRCGVGCHVAMLPSVKFRKLSGKGPLVSTARPL